jgi:RimJ/RimL family protein N-acetyltransferase
MTLDSFDAVIRPFEAGDRNMVNEFFDSLGPESKFFFNSTDGNRRFAMRFWDDSDEKQRSSRRFFAATIPDANGGETMVGYVFLWDLNTKIPWLGICVRDGYKGKHLGIRLMETARQCACDLGCGGIMLTTHVANTRAQGLYRKCGYTHLGTHTSTEFLYLLRLPNQ